MKKILEVIKKISVIIFIIYISFTICKRSELNPQSKKVPTIDSDVYIYIGQELNNGKVVYKDIFDHKGPLFHFIEFIGVKFSPYKYVGVWAIELIAMIVTFTFLYKTAKIITKNKYFSIITVFLASVPLSLFLINGNYPEEFANPFIAMGLYYAIKKLSGYETKKIEDFFSGVCLSSVILIKLNLIAVWIVFMPILLFRMLKRREWKKLKEFIIIFAAGTLIPILITIIVLCIQGNLIECFKQYIVFNFKYTTDTAGNWKETLEMFVTKIYIISVCCLVIDLIYKIIKKQKGVIFPIASLVYLLFALYIVIMPNNAFRHYGLVLTPTYIVPIALGIKDMTEMMQTKEYIFTKIVASIALVFFSLYITRHDLVIFAKDVMLVNEERFATKKDSMIEYIKENTNKEDSILVLGNGCNIYLMSERTSNCKYVYQVPIVRIDYNIVIETINEITIKKPKIIVLQHTIYEELTDAFLKYVEDSKDYEYIRSYNGCGIYLINN